MERYVKANRKVAEFLHLTEDRTQLQDDNFLLWCQDLLPFGKPIEFEKTLSQIGAIAMDGKTASKEQDGEVCNKLPVAIDNRFKMQDNVAEEESHE